MERRLRRGCSPRASIKPYPKSRRHKCEHSRKRKTTLKQYRWNTARGLPVAILGVALDRPKAMLTCWALLLLLAIPGILQLRIDTSTDNVLDRTTTQWTNYQESLDLFGGDELLVVVLATDEPFEPQQLEHIITLTSQLEDIEGVRRVDSLSTVPLIRVNEDGDLLTQASLADGVPGTDAERMRLRTQLRADRIAPASLISEDERTLAVNVFLEGDMGTEIERVLEEVRAVAASSGGWVSGVPVFRTEINLRTGAEIGAFVIITVLLVGVLLGYAFRSVVAVACPLLIGGVGTFATLSSMGTSGVPITLSTMILPSIMLALGCAYSMHILTAAGHLCPGDSIREALHSVAVPVALSGITTCIGFLAIGFVRIDAIRQVGNFGAFGVFVVTAATLTVLPALMKLYPKPIPAMAHERWLQNVLQPFLANLIKQRGTQIIALSTMVVGLFSIGLFQLTIETDVTRWFAPGNEIRDAYDEIGERLSGISPMNVIIEAPAGRSVLEPETLAAIDALSTHLQSLPEVGKSLSIADPLRMVHGGFVEDASLPLPGRRDLAEQYLLMLESLEQVEDFVTDDRRYANIVLRVDNNGSRYLVGLAADVDQWWAENGTPGYRVSATGIMYEFARGSDAIASGQLQGLSFALAIIAALLFAMFRSLPLTLAALIPNVVPIAVGFGLMGLAKIPLDAGTVLAGSLALGIAVDDTIHVVSAYYDRIADGELPEKACSGSLEKVLPALIATTIITGVGFAVLGLSSFAFTRNLGLLVAGVLAICLIADALLLPSILVRCSISTRILTSSLKSG